MSALVDMPIGALVAYPGNARVHNETVLDESVAANGQYRAIVARLLPDGAHQILAGHGTRNALARSGAQTVRVEVIDADDEAARRIVLADNRTSELASYDDTLLAGLLDAASLDGGLLGTGYTGDDYRALLEAVAESEASLAGLTDAETEALDDQDTEPPAEPVTKLGDMWRLGPHRVLCGSATAAVDVEAVLNGEPPGIVYTDPPYGISIVQGAAVGASAPRNPSGKVIPATVYKPVIGDETTDTARDAFALTHGAHPDALHVWWGANHYAGSAGLGDTPCWLVWDKQNSGDFADAELAWIDPDRKRAVRMFRHMWNGMIRASEQGRGQRVHPNQKPVALARWALDLIDPDRKRAIVLDVFGGSGSTALAAHATGRTARIIELDPGYVDVICRRLQDLSGEMPVLESTGEPHDFLATP